LKISNQPFDVYQVMQAQQYGHQKVYPNSENVYPPVDKARKRVIEAATRTEIRMNRIKEIEERAEEVRQLREQAKVRYASEVPYTEGDYIDIDV